MTATDELHGQLDTGYPHSLRLELHKALKARGIDYWVAQGITFWNRDDGCECLAYGYQADGVPKLAIKVVGFTDPEQAIAATVGLQIVDRLRVFASCAYGIASEFMRSNGCPYYDNGMECSLSEECEEKDWAEQPDCLLDALAKALGIEVDE